MSHQFTEADVTRRTTTLLESSFEVEAFGVKHAVEEVIVPGLGRIVAAFPLGVMKGEQAILLMGAADSSGDRWVAHVDQLPGRVTSRVYRELRQRVGITYRGVRSALGCGSEGRPVWERRGSVRSVVVGGAADGAATTTNTTSGSGRTRRPEGAAASGSARLPSPVTPGASRLSAALVTSTATVTPRSIPWKVTSCDREGKPTERWWCPPDLYGVVVMDSAIESACQPRGRYKVGYYDTQLFRERGDIVVSAFSFGAGSARDALRFVDELRAMNTKEAR